VRVKIAVELFVGCVLCALVVFILHNSSRLISGYIRPGTEGLCDVGPMCLLCIYVFHFTTNMIPACI